MGLVLIAASCALTAGAVWSAAPAAATVNCVDGPFDHFAGWGSTAAPPGGQLTYEGAAAIFTNSSATICDTGVHTNSFNYVWSMIAQNANAHHDPGTATGYVQMGFYRVWGGCTYYTSEYHRDYLDTTLHRWSHTGYGCVGGTHQYWVQYVSPGTVRMNVDSVMMDSTPWSPYGAWQPSTTGPFSAQWAGETTYLGTDVPSATFSSMQVQNFDNSWTATLPTLYNGCPWPVRYAKTGVSNNSFSIWTSGTSQSYYCS